MSRIFSAREICENALRVIGSLSVNDTAAPKHELDIALRWLDIELAELAGVEEVLWLVPDTLEVPLTATVASYDLDGTLGSDAPADGIQFPKSAKLDHGSGDETDLTIITRREYEDIDNKAQSGTPEKIYIDRLADPKMFIWPVIGVAGFKVRLLVQTFGPTIKGNGQMATSLRASWNKWAINQTAAAIGNGPVRKLPRSEVSDLNVLAERSRRRLLAFENREHTNTPRRTAYRDF